jgi:GGDEF domain-containing protein
MSKKPHESTDAKIGFAPISPVETRARLAHPAMTDPTPQHRRASMQEHASNAAGSPRVAGCLLTSTSELRGPVRSFLEETLAGPLEVHVGVQSLVTRLRSLETSAIFVTQAWLRDAEQWDELTPLLGSDLAGDHALLACLEREATGLFIARALDHKFDDVLTLRMSHQEAAARIRNSVRLHALVARLRSRQGLDPETGLFSGSVMPRHIASAMAMSARHGTVLYNSTFTVEGLESIDESANPAGLRSAMTDAGAVILILIRPYDSAFRVGPASFMVLWTDVNRAIAEMATSRVRHGLEACLRKHSRAISVRAEVHEIPQPESRDALRPRRG